MREGAPNINRREFIRNAAAFFIANGALNKAKPLIAGERYEDRESAGEALVRQIREYEATLQDNEELFADGLDVHNRTQTSLIAQAPPAIRELLEGSELDPDAFFRSRGSWPSIGLKIKVNSKTEIDTFPYIVDLSPEYDPERLPTFNKGNAFLVDGIVLSNTHVFDGSGEYYETLSDDYDIAAGSIYERGTREEGWDILRENAERLSLEWDRRRNQESLHGKTIHIGAVHFSRSRSDDHTEIITGVAWNRGNFKQAVDVFDDDSDEYIVKNRKGGYGVVIPTRDLNHDGKVSVSDYTGQGLSGAVVMTDSDVQAGLYRPSGIVVGDVIFADPVSQRTFHVLTLHGPDVIGAMVDKANTLISKDQDPHEVPNHAYVTREVQEKLVSYGAALEVDGAFGPVTEEAVKAFQIETFDAETLVAKIIPGVVDRRTWNALFPDKANPSKNDLLYLV